MGTLIEIDEKKEKGWLNCQCKTVLHCHPKNTIKCVIQLISKYLFDLAQYKMFIGWQCKTI